MERTCLQYGNTVGGTYHTSVYDIFQTLGSGYEGAGVYLTLIALILGCLLFAACVLGILNALNVTKIKCVNYIAYALAGLFAVISLVALILVAVDVADANASMLPGASLSVGAGIILIFVSSILAAIGIAVANLKLAKK